MSPKRAKDINNGFTWRDRWEGRVGCSQWCASPRLGTYCSTDSWKYMAVMTMVMMMQLWWWCWWWWWEWRRKMRQCSMTGQQCHWLWNMEGWHTDSATHWTHNASLTHTQSTTSRAIDRVETVDKNCGTSRARDDMVRRQQTGLDTWRRSMVLFSLGGADRTCRRQRTTRKRGCSTHWPLQGPTLS